MLPRQVCHGFQVADTTFWIAPPEIQVKSCVARSRVGTVLLVRSVKKENSSGWEDAPCPCHQPLSCPPRGNVDHVDGNDRISPLHGPFRGVRFEDKGWEQIRQASHRPMSGDALEGSLITICGLSGQLRKGCRKVNGVLTGPTGNLQNLPGRREQPAKHAQDGIAIAGNRG